DVAARRQAELGRHGRPGDALRRHLLDFVLPADKEPAAPGGEHAHAGRCGMEGAGGGGGFLPFGRAPPARRGGGMKRTTVPLSPAAAAFDAIAPAFDERYGPWLSVNAQRRAVRADLERAFSPGSSVVEVGGGTGEDARWLAERGRRVLTTDASPAMVRIAAEKLAGVAGSHAQVLPAEQ